MKYSVDNLSKKISRRKKIKKIISRIIYILLTIFLVFNIIIAIQKVVSPKKTPNIFGFKAFTIITDSMSPTIETNDLIITKNCKENEIAKGDIITFNRTKTLITHRVDRISEETGKKYFITKGDNNHILDQERIDYYDIEGKYFCKISGAGKFAKLFKNEKIIIAIIIVLFLVNYFNYKMNKKRIMRQEQRRKYEMDI